MNGLWKDYAENSLSPALPRCSIIGDDGFEIESSVDAKAKNLRDRFISDEYSEQDSLSFLGSGTNPTVI